MTFIQLLFVVYSLQNVDKCSIFSLEIEKMTEKSVIKSFSKLYKICPEQALHIPCFIPLKNFEGTNISSGYGMRKHPFNGIIKHHNGIDISSPIREVIATGSGIIVELGYKKGLGNYISIDHQNSYQTTYGHLSKIMVKKGQIINIIEIIGMVGSTGTSTGNHIHYEIRKNGALVNPIEYLLLFYDIYQK